jgi:hypothetical protein
VCTRNRERSDTLVQGPNNVPDQCTQISALQTREAQIDISQDGSSPFSLVSACGQAVCPIRRDAAKVFQRVRDQPPALRMRSRRSEGNNLPELVCATAAICLPSRHPAGTAVRSSGRSDVQVLACSYALRGAVPIVPEIAGAQLAQRGRKSWHHLHARSPAEYFVNYNESHT